MSHFASMYFYYPLNTQFSFHYIYDSRFGDRALNILRRHHIHYFILNSGYSVHVQPNYNGPDMVTINFYSNAIMNWINHHGTLKFTLPHINSILVEALEYFKLSSTTFTQKCFKKTHLLHLSPIK